MNIVSGRAIWNIQKGEIARLITETEFAAADNLKGVIIQEGCMAMVYIDGQLVSMMPAGVYTFPAKTETKSDWSNAKGKSTSSKMSWRGNVGNWKRKKTRRQGQMLRVSLRVEYLERLQHLDVV